LRSMVVPLKGEELVNGGDRSRVGAQQPYSSTSRNCVRRVLNGRPAGPHFASPRNLTSMHETGKREVAARESAGDLPHVSSNPGHASSIARVAPEYYAATIRERLELVKRGVLIDSHRDMPAGLYPGEPAVG
jgi:hypothetical protein